MHVLAGDYMCYVYNEKNETWIPWGPNSKLLIFNDTSGKMSEFLQWRGKMINSFYGFLQIDVMTAFGQERRNVMTGINLIMMVAPVFVQLNAGTIVLSKDQTPATHSAGMGCKQRARNATTEITTMRMGAVVRV